jgi:membrane protease YdiL (CAAX protease family)
MILTLYPLLSALPQELVFRPLFFRRYGALFPGTAAAVACNALVFGLAHLMFWNWVALALTVAGGLIFARAYLGRGGFAMAVVLHAVCGAIIFTSGLGTFFYHGAVPLR